MVFFSALSVLLLVLCQCFVSVGVCQCFCLSVCVPCGQVTRAKDTKGPDKDKNKQADGAHASNSQHASAAGTSAGAGFVHFLVGVIILLPYLDLAP